MIEQSKFFKELLAQLKQIPYVASKNIYRVLEHFLKLDHQKIDQFCQTLKQLKERVDKCQVCHVWKEKGAACYYCNAAKRDQQLVCVVETWHELMAIEKTGGYKGVYHVLGGVISPLDGIDPEDLTINALINRVACSEVKEVILATNQTPEGEATAAYIAQQLKPYDVTVTCLARGMPVGSSLEYMDRITVYKALDGRRPF